LLPDIGSSVDNPQNVVQEAYEPSDHEPQSLPSKKIVQKQDSQFPFNHS